MMYGDSISAGLYNGQPSNLFDNFILDELSDNEITNFMIDNQGIPGASTTSALENMDKISSEKLEYIIFNVGINDAINNRKNIQEYQKNLRKMISEVSSKNIILLGPSYVDQQKKPQVNYEILKAYNSSAKLVSENENVHFIDIYQHMIDYPNTKELLQNDGLHPSRFGYHYLSKKIVNFIVQKENEAKR